MKPPRVLIACIGNIFLGDDAFGVEVAQRLLRRPQPPEARVVDFGIRGIDLFYALQDGCETVILVDAVRRGHEPGTLYLIAPEPIADADALAPDQMMIDSHSMDPMRVLQLAAAMPDRVKQVLLVGCEPQSFGEVEDWLPEGLSAPVRGAVDEAVEKIESLTRRILEGDDQPLSLMFPPGHNQMAGGKEIQSC